MSVWEIPWLELGIAVALAGSACVSGLRRPVVAFRCGQTLDDVLKRTLRKDGDPVVAFLSMGRDVVSETFEDVGRERLVGGLDLLQADDVW